MKTKEEIALYQKEYRLKNKEKLLKKQKEYYELNKENILSHNKEYSKINSEKVKEMRKSYYESNKEKIIKQNIEYEKENKEYITLRRKTKRHAYRAMNPLPENRESYNTTLAERYKDEWINEILFLYYIKMTEEDGTVFFKYGLSKNVKNRMHKIPYKVDILEIIKSNKYDAIYLEESLLKNKKKYMPINKFKGYTECFTN